MLSRFFSGFVKCCVGAATLWLVANAVTPASAQSPTPGQFNLFAPATPAPQPLAATTPANAGYQPPKELKRGPLTYPILANLNRVEGVVGVRFVIDESGKVKNATVYRTSRSFLLDAVVKSRGIMEWTFQPATLDGKPIPSTLDKEIEFHLDPAEQRQFALKRIAAPVGTPDPPYPAEAMDMSPRPRGDCTIGVFWTPAGHVNIINLLKSSGSATLDHAALRFAYENWRIDPKQIKEPKEQFTKVLTFAPTASSSGSPPPLASETPPPLDAATPTPTPTKAAGSVTPKPKRAH